MAKFVTYNGGTHGYKECSNYKNLVLGETYKIVSEVEDGLETYYTLKGKKGLYNSEWFDEIPPNRYLYIAASYTEPKVNENYLCFIVDFIDGMASFVPVTISSVEDVKFIAGDMYYIETTDSMFVVKVI